jgi:hypothetical protein
MVNNMKLKKFKIGNLITVIKVGDPRSSKEKKYLNKKGKVIGVQGDMVYVKLFGFTSPSIDFHKNFLALDESVTEASKEDEFLDKTWSDTFGKEKGDKLAAKQKFLAHLHSNIKASKALTAEIHKVLLAYHNEPAPKKKKKLIAQLKKLRTKETALKKKIMPEKIAKRTDLGTIMSEIKSDKKS